MLTEKLVVPVLEKNCSPEQYLFSIRDFSPLFPDLNYDHLKTLINRLAHKDILERICNGIYAYKPAVFSRGFLLFHAAAKLRQGCFNYVSLESALSEYGIISQVLINYVTILTAGRRGIIHCGKYGTIEFVHTKTTMDKVFAALSYDERYRLYRADAALAYADMVKTRRSTIDLVQTEVLHDFVQ